ncbi:nicotinate (nicotinamide) nucleotide adenylyltransferase [bacterium]|nr:MAG: nicotinate (nicotinamide) nucleotide adenylyltransferase [bacterium]
MRIGILGGTFDPPHNGHLAVARAAMKELALDEILFVPAAKNPLKGVGPRASAEDRLTMLGLLVAGEPTMGVVDVELQRGGQSYTVDTLSDLHLVRPGDYWFILGADALKGLNEWKQPAKLLRMCRLGVVARPSTTDSDVAMRVAAPHRDRIDVIRMNPMDVSSTEIRNRLAQRKTIAPYVPQAIDAYIEEKGLYQD